MCSDLSSQRSLDHIKNEAKKLLHALRRGDAAALRRYYSVNSFAGLSEPRLDDAQYVIARERGYSSWQKLKEHLRTTSSSRNC
jgi:hypothetical protein